MDRTFPDEGVAPPRRPLPHKKNESHGQYCSTLNQLFLCAIKNYHQPKRIFTLIDPIGGNMSPPPLYVKICLGSPVLVTHLLFGIWCLFS